MNFFTYRVVRDYGFAPNPFNGICTLATCKSRIRKKAQVGDWIFGIGSVTLKCQKHLIYAMKITKKMSYNEYWSDNRFACKKPVMNGSLKTMYGDNIYHHDGEQWYQADSHHSLEGGVVNEKNLKSDTRADYVIISTHFFYFGENHFEILPEISEEICHVKRGFRYADIKISLLLIQWLESQYSPGYHGDPMQFSKFERFKG